jgi:hypothetical protein
MVLVLEWGLKRFVVRRFICHESNGLGWVILEPQRRFRFVGIIMVWIWVESIVDSYSWVKNHPLASDLVEIALIIDNSSWLASL